MIRAIVQNTALIGALVIGAGVGGTAAPLLTSARGAFGPGVLQADALVAAIGGVLLTVLVCTALAVVVGRLSNTVVGLFALGGGLFGLAWRMGEVHEIVFTGSLFAVGIETVIWSLVVLGATVAVFRLSGPLSDVEPDEDGRRPDPFRSVEALKMGAAGAVVIPVVWLVAQTDAKGQVIGAVFCGGMAAGLAGRLLSPHVQPILIFATPVLFGGLAHLYGAVTVETPLFEAVSEGLIGPLSRPMPIDYACGSLLGVSVGVGWARSFLHHEETPAHAARASG
jgi:hypothetical protein